MRKKSLEQIVAKNKGHEYLHDPLDRISSVVLFVLIMLSLSVFLSVKYVDNTVTNGRMTTGFVVQHYKVIHNGSNSNDNFKIRHYEPEYPNENSKAENRISGRVVQEIKNQRDGFKIRKYKPEFPKQNNRISGNAVAKTRDEENILSRIKHSPNRTTIMMMLYVFWIVIVGIFQLYGHEKEIKNRRKKQR